jgi:hypothetical protein
MVGKRGERLSLAFFAATLLLIHLSSAYWLMPEQIQTMPATIRLNYSAPVNITNGSLYSVATGEALQQYDAAKFTDTGDKKTFLIEINGIFVNGLYDLVVSKTDGQPPYKPLPDDAVRFDYFPSDAGLNIHLASPKPLAGPGAGETGFASSSPYDLVFTTTKPAWCKYSTTGQANENFMADFSVTGTPAAPVTTHKILTQTSPEINPLIVWCNSPNGGIYQPFDVGYEAAQPQFSVIFSPRIIVDPLSIATNMSIIVRNDQMVYCEAVGDGQTHTTAPAGLGSGDAGAYLLTPSVLITFAEQPAKPESKPFLVTCINRAGLVTRTTVSIPINLDYKPALNLVSPDRYTSQKSPVFAVQVVKQGIPVKAGSCAFTDGTAQQLTSNDSITYSTTFSNLADTNYTYAVRCIIAGGKEVTGSLTFTVDTVPPPSAPARSISVPDFICGDQPLNATMNLSADTAEDPNFAGYRYNITAGTGSAVLESGETMSGELTAELQVQENKTYQWHIWPFDLANNLGAELTGTTQVLAVGDPRCDHVPPTASLDINQTSAGATVMVLCSDTQSGCADTFRYTKLPTDALMADCTYADVESLNGTLLFTQDGALCYAVFDNNGNNATGFRVITVTSPVSPDTHCHNNILDANLGETGVDCGGSCQPCPDGTKCNAGTDCVSHFCNPSGICEYTSCSDGKQDGYETDVDCGGAGECPRCGEGKRCAAGTDCTSGNCQGGICAAAKSCTSDPDCPTGERCDSTTNTCVPSPKCTTDTECDGATCDTVTGICNQRPKPICNNNGVCEAGETPENCPNDCPAAKGPSILGLILLCLGLLTMAGSGYWLYTLHHAKRAEEREEQEFSSRPAYTSEQEQLTPEQRIALLRQRQAQLAALRQRQQTAVQERAAARAAERREISRALDEGKEEKPAETGERTEESGEEQQPGTAEQPEEFVDIRELAKQQEPAKPEKQESPKRTKRGAFTALDEFLGEK